MLVVNKIDLDFEFDIVGPGRRRGRNGDGGALSFDFGPPLRAVIRCNSDIMHHNAGCQSTDLRE